MTHHDLVEKQGPNSIEVSEEFQGIENIILKMLRDLTKCDNEIIIAKNYSNK